MSVLIFSFKIIFPQNKEIKAEIHKSVSDDSISKKYYRKFDSALIISFHQNYRDIEFTFDLFNNTSGPILRYKAQSKMLTGMTIAYDKFSISFNTGATDREGSVNTTKIFNLQFDMGDLKKNLQIYLRNYIGFEDITTQLHDSANYAIKGNYKYPLFSFTQLGIQRQFYTGYKKYAYKSPYGINYRQLKARGSWIWGYNIIATTFNTETDSVIFPFSIRDTFGTYSKLKGMGILQTGLIGGAAYNLVLKKFFLDITLLIAPELQFRNDKFIDKSVGVTKISYNAHFKISAGFNGNKFYWYFFGTSGVNVYYQTPIFINQYTTTGGAALGFRFTRMKVPKFYKKFKQTKLYKFL
ncbi:MAG: DUF4421 domain-containing protein [Bacteroidia bacterium]|nr:DUF4421 domain-containing protein [Bacteroidia bacterium]